MVLFSAASYLFHLILVRFLLNNIITGEYFIQLIHLHTFKNREQRREQVVFSNLSISDSHCSEQHVLRFCHINRGKIRGKNYSVNN